MSDSLDASVQAFVARQPRLVWRRRLLRAWIRFWMRILARVTILGADWVPDDGPTVMIMNHVTMLDPVIMLGAITHRFPVPMSKVENARNPLIGPFMWWYGAFTVRRGEIDRQALTKSIELLKANQLLAISPEGTRHPEGLARPKDGVAYVATKGDAIIVPIAVTGTNEWQKTVLLFRRPHVIVSFGPPFRLKTDGKARVGRELLAEMSDELMYQLARAVADPALRGEYADLSKATTKHLIFVDPRTGKPLPVQPEPEPILEGDLARDN